MRPLAIGRKNWLFVGSPLAGERAAILFSLIANCKVNLAEPWAYLRDVFARLPQGLSDEQLARAAARSLASGPLRVPLDHRQGPPERARFKFLAV